MRKVIGWIVALLIVVIGCGAVMLGCYMDYQENKAALKIQGDYSGVALDGAEEIKPVCFRVQNMGYSTIEVRQTVVLSLYDKNGKPMQMGGTSVIPSAFDLYAMKDIAGMEPEDILPQNWVYPAEGKTAQGHQTVYVHTQYITENTPWYMKCISRRASGDPVRSFEYALVKKNGLELSGYALRVDILLEGKDQQQWVPLDSYTGWLGDAAEQMPAKLREEAPKLPDLTDSNSYQWEVEGNCACLTGIGNVTDADIVIPHTVYLSAVGDRYIEDTISGQECSVSLQRGALSGCQSIRTVTFQEHVGTSEDFVWADEDMLLLDGLLVLEGPGFFEDCTNLTAVYNMPDPVTNMKAAFKNCQSLTHISRLPISTVNMEACFYGCESLTSCPEIPAGVLDMENAFYGCTALAEAPALPKDVRYLSGCFSGCTSLRGMVSISQELITSIKWKETDAAIFENCDQLEKIEVDYCQRIPLTKFSETTPVVYLRGEHNREGLCEACRYVTLTTKIDGITVVMEEVPEERYLFLVDHIDNILPDILKKTCKKIIFTLDVDKYDTYYLDNDLDGFAKSQYGHVYAQYAAYSKNHEAALDTLYHELTHCYDANYSNNYRFSSSQKWIEIHTEEEKQAKTRYSEDLYDSFAPKAQRAETFAIAVSAYFTDVEWLKENCPGMYAYVEDLFGVYETE